MKGFKIVIVGLAALLASATALAQDNDSGIRKFYIKKQEEPPPPPQQQTPDQSSDDQVSPDKFRLGHRLRTLVDFPRYFLTVTYLPEYVGVNQKLESSGQEFTLSQFSLLSLQALLGVRLNDAMTVALDTSYSGFSVGSQSFSAFTIDSSSPGLQNTHLSLEYCIANPNDVRKRWCPFIQIGIESFLAFAFQDPSDLALKTINDMTIGAGLNYEFPLTPLMTGRATASYIQGLVTGQNGNTQLNSDNVWLIGFASDYVYNEHWTLTGGVSFEERTYESQSLNGANFNKFDGSLTSYIFKIAGRYNF